MKSIRNSYKKLLKILKIKGNSIPDNPLAFLDDFETLSDVKGIILGQDPYAYPCSKTGKPLATGRLFATECEKEPYSLSIFKHSLEIVFDEVYGIDNVKIDNNLSILKDMGIMLLSVAWTTEFTKPGAHLFRRVVKGKSIGYSNLTRLLLKKIALTNVADPIPILALGAEATKVVKSIAPKFKCFYNTHPAAENFGKTFPITPVKQFFKYLNYENSTINSFLNRD